MTVEPVYKSYFKMEGLHMLPSLPQQEAVSAAVQQPAVAQQSAQHPGWMWDQEANQWVPDPNYQPPGQ